MKQGHYIEIRIVGVNPHHPDSETGRAIHRILHQISTLSDELLALEEGGVEFSCSLLEGGINLYDEADEETPDDWQKQDELMNLFRALDKNLAREGTRCACDNCQAAWSLRDDYEAGKLSVAEAHSRLEPLVERAGEQQVETYLRELLN